MKGFSGIRAVSLGVVLLSLAYAIVRYHLLQGVEWIHLPLFIANKALALSAAILIALSFWTARLGRDERWPCWLGMIGYGLAAAHSLASLGLLDPAYYGKFFLDAGGRMNLRGELSTILGVGALICFTCAAVTSVAGVRQGIDLPAWKCWQRVGVAGVYLTLGHVTAMGLEGWLKTEAWPLLLPPISLVAGVALAATLVFRWAHRRNGNGNGVM